MKLILRIYMILCTAVFSLYVLFLIAGLTARQLTVTQMQNGVVLARKHIFNEYREVYLFKESGELIVDEPVYWMKVSHNYIDAQLFDHRFILYDINADELLFSTSEGYRERKHALDDMSESDECQWRTSGSVGPVLILHNSSYLDRIIARQCGDIPAQDNDTGSGAQ